MNQVKKCVCSVLLLSEHKNLAVVSTIRMMS